MKRLLLAALLLWPAVSLAADFRTGQVSVTTSAVATVGSATNRVSLTIFNTDSTNPIFCGNSSVTSSTGMKVAAGYGLTIDAVPSNSPTAARTIGCISTGGTVTTTFWESVK